MEIYNFSDPKDYSWIRVKLRHLKRKSFSFVKDIIKHFKEVTWSRRGDVRKEFMCVMTIILSLAGYCWIISLFIKSIL